VCDQVDEFKPVSAADLHIPNSNSPNHASVPSVCKCCLVRVQYIEIAAYLSGNGGEYEAASRLEAEIKTGFQCSGSVANIVCAIAGHRRRMEVNEGMLAYSPGTLQLLHGRTVENDSFALMQPGRHVAGPEFESHRRCRPPLRAARAMSVDE
jgi:hypothetical protein